MLPENTKSNFNISVGRYASISVNLVGAVQDVMVINYRHTDQDLDQIASQVFNQLTNLNDTTLNHFVPLLQPNPYRVDLTIYPGEISEGRIEYLFDFSTNKQGVYRITINDEDLKSERMLKCTLEMILYALLFHFKPTRIIEEEYDRSPEFERLQERVQRERGRGQSRNSKGSRNNGVYCRSHGRYELSRGR